jgi:hypothetical protein
MLSFVILKKIHTDVTSSWLISHGRVKEADQIIADLEDLDVNDPWVNTESKEIQWAAQVERENGVPFKDLLRGRTGNQKGARLPARDISDTNLTYSRYFSYTSSRPWRRYSVHATILRH